MTERGNGTADLFGSSGWLLDDADLRALFSPKAELDAILAFELSLARAQTAVGEIPAESLAAIEQACGSLVVDEAMLVEGLRRDGVVIPSLVALVRAKIGIHASSFHKGATSQDAIDSGMMLRSKQAIQILKDRLGGFLKSLEAFRERTGSTTVMARTRFQDALPIALADRIDAWCEPLRQLLESSPQVFPIQLGGPVGVADQAFGVNRDTIARAMATELGLTFEDRSWHTDRRPVLILARWCADIAGAIAKIGVDTAIMSQNPVGEVSLSGGSSSSMPHKNNPVLAERLVTLSRYATGNLAMLEGNAIHENERSGMAWTLEWLALPPVLVASGTAIGCADKMLARLAIRSVLSA